MEASITNRIHNKFTVSCIIIKRKTVNYSKYNNKMYTDNIHGILIHVKNKNKNI